MRKLLPILAFALAACASSAPRPDEAPGYSVCDYFPLAVGNRWVYDGPAQPNGQREPITVSITGKREGFYEQTGNQLITCDAEGLRDQKRLLIQPPLQRGHAWKSVVSVTAVEQYSIIDVGSTVNVPAGTFRDTLTTLAKQRIDAQRTLVNETTYAPGVGIVRISTRLLEGEKEIPQIEIALREYQLAPKADAEQPKP